MLTSPTPETIGTSAKNWFSLMKQFSGKTSANRELPVVGACDGNSWADSMFEHVDTVCNEGKSSMTMGLFLHAARLWQSKRRGQFRGDARFEPFNGRLTFDAPE